MAVISLSASSFNKLISQGCLHNKMRQ